MTNTRSSPDKPVRNPSEPLTVFIVSWGRPIYLWSCLDALYRLTKSPARFVLLDNPSSDPTIDEVIAGFERRGIFSEIVRFPVNSFANIKKAYRERLDGLGPLHVYIESDCMIGDTPRCWLEDMRRIMEENPQIGVLGSLIDPRDYVAPETALRLTKEDPASAEFLAKLRSPERAFIDDCSWASSESDYFVTDPPCPIGNPPGRLMMLRTSVMQELGFQLDSQLAARIRERGLVPAVTPRVRHRHLSLLNIYDYADYDLGHRSRFFANSGEGAA
jgi:hypothetical protein